MLTAHDIDAESIGDRLLLRGTTGAAVSQLAFDHGIRLVELTESVAITRGQPARPDQGVRRVRLRLIPAPTHQRT